MDLNLNWLERFFSLAQNVGEWSKDPSTKVGAVIINDLKQVVGLGFNGFPRGIRDEGLEDRELKLALTVHAEKNAILNATTSVRGCTLISTYPTCNQCAAFIIQAGIAHVYCPRPTKEQLERMVSRGDVWLYTLRAYEEAGVRLTIV